MSLIAATILGGIIRRHRRPAGFAIEGSLPRRQRARGLFRHRRRSGAIRRSATAPASRCHRPEFSSHDRVGALMVEFYLLLPITLGVLLINVNWLRSAYGRAWMAIHHRDISAEIARYQRRRLQAACVSARARRRPALPVPCGPTTPASFRSKPSTSTCLSSISRSSSSASWVDRRLHSRCDLRDRAAAPGRLRHRSDPQRCRAWAARSSNCSRRHRIIMLLFLILEPRGLAGNLGARTRLLPISAVQVPGPGSLEP